MSPRTPAATPAAAHDVELIAQPFWWAVRQASNEPAKGNGLERRALEVVGLDPRAVWIGMEVDGWIVESLSKVADGVSVTLRRLPSKLDSE